MVRRSMRSSIAGAVQCSAFNGIVREVSAQRRRRSCRYRYVVAVLIARQSYNLNPVGDVLQPAGRRMAATD